MQQRPEGRLPATEAMRTTVAKAQVSGVTPQGRNGGRPRLGLGHMVGPEPTADFSAPDSTWDPQLIAGYFSEEAGETPPGWEEKTQTSWKWTSSAWGSRPGC